MQLSSCVQELRKHREGRTSEGSWMEKKKNAQEIHWVKNTSDLERIKGELLYTVIQFLLFPRHPFRFLLKAACWARWTLAPNTSGCSFTILESIHHNFTTVLPLNFLHFTAINENSSSPLFYLLRISFPSHFTVEPLLTFLSFFSFSLFPVFCLIIPFIPTHSNEIIAFIHSDESVTKYTYYWLGPVLSVLNTRA